ncbi:MAG: toprim domain-containing protein [Acidobacteria bacterium]|nr:toprim domain-containing protein [Acidobacteriota bacterium]
MNQISLLKQQADIVQIISGFIHLKQKGTVWIGLCPFHQEKTPSFTVSKPKQIFKCFGCGEGGDVLTFLSKFERISLGVAIQRLKELTSSPNVAALHGKTEVAPTRSSDCSSVPSSAVETTLDYDLTRLLTGYQAALPGSVGETFLNYRGISLKTAQKFGLGYAANGRWEHRLPTGKLARNWKWGRLVFPHTDPAGRVVNLYGRAVGIDSRVPRDQRHDHLPGRKGYFNSQALAHSVSPVWCEGTFDALTLLELGIPAVAIFGIDGWHWEWVQSITNFYFAFDADAAGQTGWKRLARQCILRGKKVWFIPPEVYGQHKDINAAHCAGTLQVTAFEKLSG